MHNKSKGKILSNWSVQTMKRTHEIKNSQRSAEMYKTLRKKKKKKKECPKLSAFGPSVQSCLQSQVQLIFRGLLKKTTNYAYKIQTVKQFRYANNFHPMQRMRKEKSAQARHDTKKQKKKTVTSPSSLAFRGKQLVFQTVKSVQEINSCWIQTKNLKSYSSILACSSMHLWWWLEIHVDSRL